MDKSTDYDVIVVGAGPAGLTAALYLSRAKVKTLVIDSGIAGGQTILTHEIANYPGIERISGYQLAHIMKKQAESFGTEIKINAEIERIVLDRRIKEIKLKKNENIYTAKAVIFSLGGRSRTIGATKEEYFKGKGISYCATCDGDFFTDKEIVVVGGGNSALEEAVSLTKYASKVTIVHQFDYFQAFPHAIEEAKKNTKINFMLNSRITAFNGDEKIESVDIENIKTKEITPFKTDGVFIFIGYLPNTELVEHALMLNEWKEIIVKSDMSTNVEGVYAAGDCINKKIRQVTTAVADGTVAALSAIEYVMNFKSK